MPLLRIFSSILLFILIAFNGKAWCYSPYSTKELEELEKEFIEQINQADNIIRHPLATQYINHLAKGLNHQQLINPYFFIVKSNEINAFAGPGGYIGVNSQLILSTENESELAAVMAHEMAHVRLHHLYRLIEHEKQMRVPMLASLLASAALGVINPTLASGALMASLTGFAQDNINFIRANEKEADRIGIDMLIKSGFDPAGMAGFFKKMQANARYYYTANTPAILRTHPLDEDRITEAENRSFRIKKQTYHDHFDYYLFKELVRINVAAQPQQLLNYYQYQCKSKFTVPCDFGRALTYLELNQYEAAEKILATLLTQYPDNLYFVITMAQAETGNKQYASATQRLGHLLANYPDNYAILSSYAQSLMDAGKAELAASILLKGSRVFKGDLLLCEQLARAQAANNRKGYAYFTKAECHLLQGRKKDAMQQLKMAKSLAKSDHLLTARIDAKMEEVKYWFEN